MSELNFKRKGSASGEDSSVVLFVHGYGADGADLLGLADPLAPHLPDTVFVVCDDGSIWHYAGERPGPRWREDIPIPGTDAGERTDARANL